MSIVHSIVAIVNPSVAPDRVNQHYVNTVNGNIYLSKGTSSVADWVLVGAGGGGSIIVQDEGSPLTTAVTKFNFVGAGVTVTEPVADEILVTIPGGAGSSWTKYTISHIALQAAALTNNAAVLTLPIKGIVTGILIKTTTAFSGGGITDYDLTVGITGNESKHLPTYDALAAVAGGNYDISSVAVGGADLNATEDIKVFATSAGANLDQSAAGSVDIYVKTETLP